MTAPSTVNCGCRKQLHFFSKLYHLFTRVSYKAVVKGVVIKALLRYTVNCGCLGLTQLIWFNVSNNWRLLSLISALLQQFWHFWYLHWIYLSPNFYYIPGLHQTFISWVKKSACIISNCPLNRHMIWLLPGQHIQGTISYAAHKFWII